MGMSLITCHLPSVSNSKIVSARPCTFSETCAPARQNSTDNVSGCQILLVFSDSRCISGHIFITEPSDMTNLHVRGRAAVGCRGRCRRRRSAGRRPPGSRAASDAGKLCFAACQRRSWRHIALGTPQARPSPTSAGRQIPGLATTSKKAADGNFGYL